MAVRVDLKHIEPFVDAQALSSLSGELESACLKLENRSGEGADFLGWLDLPFKSDTDELERVKSAARRIREESDILVVVGIGGSYLGARAVIELLGSQFFNEKSPLKIYFAGNN
ncbi:MAG: glucose-6-phosphate isomerase, partial [Oscillospiraceae bacterium]|nr:glucose-6-phosphate isomerase [Oscillospiraceae bacterium]